MASRRLHRLVNRDVLTSQRVPRRGHVLNRIPVSAAMPMPSGRLSADRSLPCLGNVTQKVKMGVSGQGRPNPDIAAELFSSRTTAPTHVPHTLAKPGAWSRTETGGEALRLQPPSVPGPQAA
jgi:hypothetical protein